MHLFFNRPLYWFFFFCLMFNILHIFCCCLCCLLLQQYLDFSEQLKTFFILKWYSLILFFFPGFLLLFYVLLIHYIFREIETILQVKLVGEGKKRKQITLFLCIPCFSSATWTFKKMEKKVDTCSPTGVLEDFFRSEEFERTSSCKEPTNNQSSKQGGSKWRGLAQLFRSKSKKSLAKLQNFGSFRLSLRSNSMRENFAVAPDFLSSSYNHRKIFTLSELQAATKNFSTG